MQVGMSPYFASFATQVPMVLVYLVGIVLAVVFWRRYPKASLFALIAFALGLVDTIGGTFLSLSIPYIMVRGGGYAGTHTMGNVFMTMAYVRGLVHVVMWALILIAIFGPRGEEK